MNDLSYEFGSDGIGSEPVIPGCTFALFEAGMVCQMEEWIDELGRYAGCESRDVIWGLNYEPDYENFK